MDVICFVFKCYLPVKKRLLVVRERKQKGGTSKLPGVVEEIKRKER